MATADDIIRRALMLNGVLAEGEVATSDTMSAGLAALNDMVESMNNEDLLIYQIQDEPFTWPANTASRTIGTGADFVTTWPLQIMDTTFVRDTSVTPNVDYPVAIITEEQYNAITLKGMVGGPLGAIYYNRAFPVGTLYAWPVPGATMQIHLATLKPLTSFAALGTSVNLPNGYNRLLRFNLACELAAEDGVEPLPEVKRIAAAARRNVKRTNGRPDVMELPAVFQRRRPGLAAFYAGFLP